MVIEICSRAKAVEQAALSQVRTSVISITSSDEKDIRFPENPNIDAVLHLKFNDLTSEYDEEGIPYGRPLPKQEDFDGLKSFADRLSCDHLIVHCWGGYSRSAAVAAAVYEFRGCRDTLRTCQNFEPNPLVYALACRELKIRQGNLRYEICSGEKDLRFLRISAGNPCGRPAADPHEKPV